ncbi:putative beta-glucosidase, partial [Roridomyces roridus]
MCAMVFLSIALNLLLATSAVQAHGDNIAKATGGTWKNGFAKAKALVNQMTIEEKVNVTTGYTGKCVGFTGEVPRLGLTAICLQDGPAGVRPARRVSQFPAGVTVASTWNRDLIAARATAIGREFHDKGVRVLLPVKIRPVAGGPLGRSPLGGRNWEGAYLHGVAAYLTVKYAQEEGVLTCAKHFIGNEQETFRDPYEVDTAADQLPISENFDDKTAHELYMWPFAEAVRAGSGSVMCSYNRLNGTHGCESDVSLNKWLKEELFFQGSIISDWGGTWHTYESAIAGLDVSMPGSAYDGLLGNFYGDELVALVKNGSVSENHLDDMVIRVLTPIFQHQDLDTYPQPTFDVRDLTVPTNNVRRDHYKIIRSIAQEAVTLVKNNRTSGGGLPLPKPASMASLAVIGEDAAASIYGGTACGDVGWDCPIKNNGTLTIGGGSGWVYPSTVSDPFAAISSYVSADGPDINQHLENWDLEAAALQASRSETALVFIAAWAMEGADRDNLTAFSQGAALVNAVAAVNNNTIVVMHVPGPIIVEDWIDHENVTAVVIAHLPGQESGNSLVPVLWGETSPSGKLPYTVAKNESDYAPNTIATDDVFSPQANFTEKLLLDYKWFDAKNITPRWEFGFGLSYTTFTYGDLGLVKSYKADKTSIQPTAEKFRKVTADPGSSMYDVLYTASIKVKNTGKVRGAEVAQLYISFPDSEVDQPLRSLRGFDKLDLAPGQTGIATFELTRKDLSVWDVVSQHWEIPEGTFKLSAGASSRDIRSVIKHTF